MAQRTGNLWQLSPSVFVHNVNPSWGEAAADDAFFACPTCGSPLTDVVDSRVSCQDSVCGLQWRVEDGLYDFKEPI
jgi:hypothetical protein